jgi:hypothetical protein
MDIDEPMRICEKILALLPSLQIPRILVLLPSDPIPNVLKLLPK